jgi:drug/metabolite transporter (DMT)-like permease
MLLAYLVLGETADAKSLAGGALITAGVFILIL